MYRLIKLFFHLPTDSTGVVIRQYMSNDLHVTVADGANKWGGEILSLNIPYETWIHLRIVWQATMGIKVYINNMLLSTFVSQSFVEFGLKVYYINRTWMN